MGRAASRTPLRTLPGTRGAAQPTHGVQPQTPLGGRQTSPSWPPKGADRGPRTFPLQTALFYGTCEGAIIAIVDPWQADAGCWAKATPPLWQYFSRLL